MAAAKGIRDVAWDAGVSIATVSYVLGNARNAGAETRARVLDAAHCLAYRPNIMACHRVARHRQRRNLQARATRLLAHLWRPAPPDLFGPIPDSPDQD
jgi:DNA-binding LacI/PurR family transcriptional regulator